MLRYFGLSDPASACSLVFIWNIGVLIQNPVHPHTKPEANINDGLFSLFRPLPIKSRTVGYAPILKAPVIPMPTGLVKSACLHKPPQSPSFCKMRLPNCTMPPCLADSGATCHLILKQSRGLKMATALAVDNQLQAIARNKSSPSPARARFFPMLPFC
jgi:hypothetical protein